MAYKYAKWEDRVVDGNVVTVGLLRVCIPQQLLTSMKELFGDDVPRQDDHLRDKAFKTGLR